MSTSIEINSIDQRVEDLKIIKAEEDKAYSGRKAYVTFELPITADGKNIPELDEFFKLDAVKNRAIRAAEGVLNRAAGWSDISRLRYYRDGREVSMFEAADTVQVTYTCLAAN